MYTNILSAKQVQLLPLVKEFAREFYLVGGTAIALHIGHRRSIDFDLLKKGNINSKKIKEKIYKTSFSKYLIHEEDNQIHFNVNDVKMTFFNYDFDIPHSLKFNNTITLPSLLDLSSMKAFALGRRAKWKDYVDMYYILKKHFKSEEISDRAAEIFAEMFSVKLFHQQLCFFKDIDYKEEVEFMPGFEIDEESVKNFLIDIATKAI